MKLKSTIRLLPALLLLPLSALASIPRGPQFSDRDVFLFFLLVLLVMSNGILALVNVLWKKRWVRVYNLVITAAMFLLACSLFFFDWRAGGVVLLIVLLLGFLIFLSVNRKTGNG